MPGTFLSGVVAAKLRRSSSLKTCTLERFPFGTCFSVQTLIGLERMVSFDVLKFRGLHVIPDEDQQVHTSSPHIASRERRVGCRLEEK